jgi:thiol-disulfide isomerase/thioredoxin
MRELLFFLILKTPSFVSEDIEGNRIYLDSLLLKGPVIVDFWATWCKYCDEVLDILKQVKDEYKDKISIITISWDTKRTESKIKPLFKSRGWDFPIIIDEGRKIGKKFGVFALPTTIIISPEGDIVYKKIGYTPKEKEEILKVLKELFEK